MASSGRRTKGAGRDHRPLRWWQAANATSEKRAEAPGASAQPCRQGAVLCAAQAGSSPAQRSAPAGAQKPISYQFIACSGCSASEIDRTRQSHSEIAASYDAQRDTLNGSGLPYGPCQCPMCRPNAKVSDESQPPMTFDFWPLLNGWLSFAGPHCSGRLSALPSVGIPRSPYPYYPCEHVHN